MKALCFQPTLRRAIPTKLLSLFTKRACWGPGSPLVLRNVPAPELPTPEWVRVRSRLAGICGSDLAAVTLKGSLDNPIKHFVSFPMFLGHETVGEVDLPGDRVPDLRPGQRVAVYPILACVPRGISPVCPSCARGDYALCRNLAAGDLPPGQAIGLNSRTGGGFSEYLVAHRSQLFPVPDTVPDEHAVLLDPLCVGLHATLLADLEDDQNVLVFGAGIIGLSVIQSIRALGKACTVYVVARHPFQRELATACGADHIVEATEAPGRTEGLAQRLGARQYASRFVAPFFMGGFDVTFDCVGSRQTLQRSLHWANHRGTIVLVGASPSERFQWSLLFWKEVRLIGSISYGMEDLDGGRRHAFALALDMMRDCLLRPDLLPLRTYPLSAYRDAFDSLLVKGRTRVVKVAFDLRPTPTTNPQGGDPR